MKTAPVSDDTGAVLLEPVDIHSNNIMLDAK
ncbi:hypothetical protein CLV58_13065 [Spirosoma oryzae]|uniref:Uncharacterized protein n=1 Tax=Spirosoma oryzae TaxID=1469603 RepID=A0A2T0S472_9BACT|nr:hypothetical protein CLV58_13065 [Spirosoma oryzae]